jgi:NTP pyrophosphatase (non-canonical NTP hydrolase)
MGLMHEMEAKIREFLIARGWDHLRPADLAKSIVIEGAELLENFQWGSLTAEELRADPEKAEKVKRELADVLIYCMELAVTMGWDTQSTIKEKLAIVNEKYPAQLMLSWKGRAGEPGVDEEYLKIKEEYRRRGLS